MEFSPGTRVQLMEGGRWSADVFTVTGDTGRSPNHLVLRSRDGVLFEVYNDVPHNIREAS